MSHGAFVLKDNAREDDHPMKRHTCEMYRLSRDGDCSCDTSVSECGRDFVYLAFVLD